MAITHAKRYYVREKPYPEKKVRTVQELEQLLREYKYVFLFDLHELPARILHEYRFRLRGKARIKVAKHTLFRIAFRRVFGDVPPEIDEQLRGERGYIFTNVDPFQFVKLVEENAVRRRAKPGDKAPYDIVVPAGPTNLSPGPILSRFGKLKIPTRVQEGKIWIAKDTVVVKAGQEINADVAEVLRVLGIMPIYESLRLIGVIWEGRRFVPISELILDIPKYRSMIEDAAKNAVLLSLGAILPVPETLSRVISVAHLRATALAAEAGILAPETVPYILRKAVAAANALAAVIAQKTPELGLQVQIPAQQIQAVQAEAAQTAQAEQRAEEQREGPSEEEIAGGLGALFG